jgi:hypothetical protein
MTDDTHLIRSTACEADESASLAVSGVTVADVTAPCPTKDNTQSLALAFQPCPEGGSQSSMVSLPNKCIPQHHTSLQHQHLGYQPPVPRGFAVVYPHTYEHSSPCSASTASSTPPYGIVYFPHKQGHKCCGCCCDVRRATIVVNVVSLCLNLFALVTYYNPNSTIYAFTFAHMIWAMMGIDGAVTYNSCLVGASFTIYIFDAAGALVVAPALVLVPLFFAYLHICLLVEMHEGIMSEETYAIEEHCCCRV